MSNVINMTETAKAEAETMTAEEIKAMAKAKAEQEKALHKINGQVAKAWTAINKKKTMKEWMVIGEALAQIEALVPSNKDRKAAIEEHVPALLDIHTVYRSEALWLYKNQNDVMQALGVAIEEMPGSPQSVHAQYRAWQKANEPKDETTSDDGEAEETTSKADDVKADDAMVDAFMAQLKTLTKAALLAEVDDLLRIAVSRKLVAADLVIAADDKAA